MQFKHTCFGTYTRSPKVPEVSFPMIHLIYCVMKDKSILHHQISVYFYNQQQKIIYLWFCGLGPVSICPFPCFQFIFRIDQSRLRRRVELWVLPCVDWTYLFITIQLLNFIAGCVWLTIIEVPGIVTRSFNQPWLHLMQTFFSAVMSFVEPYPNIITTK